MVTDKIYLAAKDLNEPKYQLLIKKFEEAGIYLKEPDPNIFTEYSNTMDDDYDNYSLKRKRKNISVFDTMITDINTNKNFSQSHSQRTIYEMQEIEYISCIYYKILFFCCKRNQIKFYALSNNE